MHFEHAVYILHTGARTGGDAPLAAGIQHFRIFFFSRCHGRNNGCLSRQLSVIHAHIGELSGRLFFQLAHARQHAQHAGHAAHALHLMQLLGHVLKGKQALFHARGNFFRLFRIHGGGGFFDQTDNIAHAQNAVCKPRWVKNLQRVYGFADTQIFNGNAGFVPHGQRRTATPVAVGARQHNACQRYAGGKLRRNTHRFLTCQTVGHKHGFVRIGGFFDRRHFAHQRFVGICATRRVKHDHIKPAQLACLHGALGNFNRPLPFNNRQCFDINLATQYGKLFHRRRTLCVQRSHQHFAFVFFLKAPSELGGAGGFTRALQADHHDADRRHRIQRQRFGGAQHVDQFVIDDFDDLLTRCHGLQNFSANRARAHTVDKSAHNRQRNIGFQQRFSNIAQRGFDIALGQRAAAAQAVEHRAQIFSQCIKHCAVSPMAFRGEVGSRHARKQFCTRGQILADGWRSCL